MKLNSWELHDDYFQKNVEIGRKLGMSEKLILEGLTDGLITEFKNQLVLNPTDSLLKWFETVIKFKPNKTASPPL